MRKPNTPNQIRALNKGRLLFDIGGLLAKSKSMKRSARMKFTQNLPLQLACMTLNEIEEKLEGLQKYVKSLELHEFNGDEK